MELQASFMKVCFLISEFFTETVNAIQFRDLRHSIYTKSCSSLMSKMANHSNDIIHIQVFLQERCSILPSICRSRRVLYILMHILPPLFSNNCLRGRFLLHMQQKSAFNVNFGSTGRKNIGQRDTCTSKIPLILDL